MAAGPDGDGASPPPAPDGAGLPTGVHFVERDWLSANQIQLFDDDALTVVDTGYVTHAPTTLALVGHALRARGPSAALTRIINTHLHSDHCGGNAALQAEHACRTLVPIGSLDTVRRWDETQLTYRDTGQECPRFVADDALAPGDVFEAGGLRWEVHAAPGHDPLSLIFFAPARRLLISADALWRHGFGIIFPELVDESGFREQQDLLKVIDALAPRQVLPGHGPRFTEVDLAIEEARARLAALQADPVRNCRSAMRALVVFRMLALDATSRDELQALLENAGIMARAAEKMGRSLSQAIDEAVESLLTGGQLRRRPDGRLEIAGR